jgi:hypothetical protein
MTASVKPQSASLDNMKGMLEERGQLAVLKKQCEDRIAQLDKDLRPVLEGRGEMFHAGYSFKCTLTAGRKTFDKAAAMEVLEPLGYTAEQFEKEGAPFTTLTVKQVQQL